MDAKTIGGADMNNFEPSFDWVREEECDSLLIYLPGFTREQLRVQLTRTRVLKISGARPIEGNKWSSFHKDFPVSDNCETNKITAKFEEGILYVRLPKVIVPAEKKDEIIPPFVTPQSHPKMDTTPPHQENNIKHQAGGVKDKHDTKETERNNESQTDYVAGSVDNHHKVRAGKIEADLVNNSDMYKASSPAAKLKMSRQMTKMVVALLFAFALGMYVGNRPWFSSKPHN